MRRASFEVSVEVQIITQECQNELAVVVQPRTGVGGGGGIVSKWKDLAESISEMQCAPPRQNHGHLVLPSRKGQFLIISFVFRDGGESTQKSL